jgi:hypothetical protein
MGRDVRILTRADEGRDSKLLWEPCEALATFFPQGKGNQFTSRVGSDYSPPLTFKAAAKDIEFSSRQFLLKLIQNSWPQVKGGHKLYQDGPIKGHVRAEIA